MYKELTSRRSGDFVCLLIRVSRVRTPDRALTITVFTDIGAVGTVIFLCAHEGILVIDGDFFMERERLLLIILQDLHAP